MQSKWINQSEQEKNEKKSNKMPKKIHIESKKGKIIRFFMSARDTYTESTAVVM